MTDKSDSDLTLTGHCYCGAVAFRVTMAADEAPIFTAYCHCDSCRRAHAAPLYNIVVVDSACFEFTKGEDMISRFHKPGASPARDFCSKCGSKVCNRFPGWNPGGKTPIGFFPDTLDEGMQATLPGKLQPVKTNRAEDCVLNWARLAEVQPAD